MDLNRALKVTEIFLLIATLMLGILWIRNKQGNYEPWIVTCGAVLGILEIARRKYLSKKESDDTALLNETVKLGLQTGSSFVSQKAGDRAIQIGGSVIDSIIEVSTEGVSERQFNRAQSDIFNNEGRKRVRAFGERMAQEGVWDWWPLGQAIEYYVDSIKRDPQNQHPWINLAYVYHLIGKRQKALECINKALELATPGPNYPGTHYKKVREAIDTDSYLTGGRVNRPPIPDWFRNNYAQYL